VESSTTGKIVAAGERLDALKGGRPSDRGGRPGRPFRHDRAKELLGLRELVRDPQGAAVRLDSDGGEQLAKSSALRPAGVRVATSSCTRRASNDVFLARPAVAGRVPGAAARRPGPVSTRSRSEGSPRLMERQQLHHWRGSDPAAPVHLDAGARARPSLHQAHTPQPAGDPRQLPADPPRDQLRRAQVATSLPGFPPTSYVTFALSFAFIQAASLR